MASITITTKTADPHRIKKQLMPMLNGIDLPPGYSFEFDPVAIRQAQALSGTIVYFLLALLFCYMVLASVNESFVIPLAILCSVPPSMAVPAIFLSIVGLPFNTATACAFVAVRGMAVNAAVLCSVGMNDIKPVGSCRFLLFRSLRQNLPVLAATTLTTVAGSAPFLFLQEGANALVKTMALVTTLGVGSSCFFAVSVVPALFIINSKK
jgi:multidrug efflux pump subunit AcrB